MCKESFGKEIMNILDIIFPRRCPLCDEVIPPDGKICPGVHRKGRTGEGTGL